MRLIYKAEDYINAHLDGKITINDLSKYIGISQFHFHRIFREFSNETINQFIIRTKMERSAMFLAIRTDISITEISQRYGYSESSAYIRSFKRYFSVTPSEYRKARNVNY